LAFLDSEPSSSRFAWVAALFVDGGVAGQCLLRLWLGLAFVFKGEPLKFELEAFLSYLETGDRGELATIEDSAKTLSILGK
jgi:hypothetical protein